MATRGKQTLVQRIALDGGKEIQAELKQLGSVGEIAFKRLQQQAERTTVATTGFTGKLQALRTQLDVVRDRVSVVTNRFSGLAGTMLRVGAAVAGAFSVTALIDITSKFTDLNSQVRLAVGELGDVSGTMERLGEIADRTYSSLENTVEGFQRNAFVLRELGLSTEQQLAFQESLNNALVVSNARGQRAEIVQGAISRAMAIGALRGEELNTVIQLGGRVTQLLTKELGVTSGELRALGEQGKITGDVVARALIGNLVELREEAESMPATIQDGFLLINNALIRFIGNADQASGVSAAIADAMRLIAENIDVVVIGLGTLVGALLLVKGVALAVELIAIGQALIGLIPPLLAVAGAILANPLFLIPAALAAITVALLHFTGTLDDVAGFIVGAFKFAIDTIGTFLSFMAQGIILVAEFFGLLGDDSPETAEKLDGVNKSLADTDDLLRGIGSKAKVNNTELTTTKTKIGEVGSEFQKMGTTAVSAIEQIGDGIQRINQDFAQLGAIMNHNEEQADALFAALSSVGGSSGSFQTVSDRSAGSITTLASGGPVSGPGSGTSDSIPAWLSNGEFVIKAAAVRKYGRTLLNALNGMRLPVGRFNMGGLVDAVGARMPPLRGGVPAFANGGPVGPSGRPLTLNIAGEVFEGLIAPDTVASRLVTYATGRQVRQMGKKPSWLGGS